jgi:hypothetical protein
MNAFAGAVTSGSYLRGNGTNVVMSTIQAADVPTLNQNTTGTASNVTGIVAVANGGTGLSSTPTNGQLNIGNGTGFTRATLSAGTGITITNGAGTISIASSVTAVTSVTGTSPVVSSGGTTPAISLASGYGDTQNPYASKTANYFLAAPNGAAGAPTFRAVVAADIPTLNQNTTGSAGSVSNTVTFNNGGAGDASGTTYNGSAARTISYNTVGASPLAGSSSLTTTGTVTSGTWSASFGAVSGANLTNLTAGNLSGTIPSAVLGNSSLNIGTTAVALNRGSANQSLTGISSVAFPGSTSGSTTLQASAIAGATTITMPATTGTMALTSDVGNGTLTLATSGTGLSGSASFTANQSGSSTFTVTSNATNLNTASTIVARDASGNFSAGTITASLSGNATSATTATTATTATSATTAGSVTNSVTFNNGGAGDASGTTYNGSAARTISYNSIGAPSTTGTNASGTWGISISGNAATATTATNQSGGTVNATTGAFSGALTGTVGLFSGQGRFGGWYVSGTGPAVEVGFSGGAGYVIAYNRTTSAYEQLNLQGGSTLLQLSGSTVNVVTGALQQGGSQVLTASNYNSYAPTLTGTGASGTWGISISGNAATATTATNQSGGTVSATTGAFSGVITSTVSSGTAINLAGQSDSIGYNATSGLGTYIKGTGNTYIYGGGKFYDGSATQTLLTSGNYSSYALPLSGGTMTGTIYSGSGVSSIIIGQYGGSTRGYLYNDTSGFGLLGYNGGWAVRVDNATVNTTFFGVAQSNTDMRAPIFYDYSNTAYYVDPASTSNVNVFNAQSVYSYGNVTAYSDERLKKDWADLPDDFIDRLAGVKSGTFTRIDTGERQIGVGAQSLQPLMAEAVIEDASGNLSVAYGNAALVSAIELAKYVTALEQRISQLEARH